MDLILWRHAEAEPGEPDLGRRLTAKGLKQAERMVGKRFSQVAHSIPLDLMRQWESEGEGASEEASA